MTGIILEPSGKMWRKQLIIPLLPWEQEKTAVLQDNGKQVWLQCVRCGWSTTCDFCGVPLESQKLAEMAVVENARELRSSHVSAHCSNTALPSWGTFPLSPAWTSQAGSCDPALSCHYKEGPRWATPPWAAGPNTRCMISGVESKEIMCFLALLATLLLM